MSQYVKVFITTSVIVSSGSIRHLMIMTTTILLQETILVMEVQCMYNFRRTARNSMLVIEFSDFVENTGRRGGGMHIHFGDKAGNNEVYIHRCIFRNNIARYSGGALAIDYSSYSFENLVNLTFCNFTRNYAEFGGGLAILSEYGKTSSGNTIKW